MTMPHPKLGFGLGLRAKHYAHILHHRPNVDWFEIISENFMDSDGKAKRNLEHVRELYPIVMHGVSLSIGTIDPLNSEYLHKLKGLIQWLKPAWVSDHLCWTGTAHTYTHDLLPLPYTHASLKHVIQRIKEVQDFLECKIALENPSTYLEFQHSNIPEAEFIARMSEESDCNILLDINNVFVTCYNHKLDVKTYLDSLPLNRVIQIHLSGHNNKGTHIIDTHDQHIADDVWQMYKYVVHKAKRVPNTMIEWDDNIPEFPVLHAELNKAKIAALTPETYSLPDLYQQEAPRTITLAPSLQLIQHHVQDAIIHGKTDHKQCTQWMIEKQHLTARMQLQIYAHAYRYRLYDVIAEDYPVLKKYLGDAKFHELLLGFIHSTQSTHFNIARFALKLPDYIKKNLLNDCFAIEICQLETAIAQLADAPETPALQQQHIANLTPEILLNSHIYLRQALQLFMFTYPVNAYYTQVAKDDSPKKPQRKSSYLVVFRHEDIIWRMNLEKKEYLLLDDLLKGHTVKESLAHVRNLSHQKLSNFFSRWMHNGVLAAHDYSRSP